MELEILKTYIENNLANNFINPSKSSIGGLIFFNKKPNKNLRLCINYQDLNTLTIKNRYLLLFIEKSLDQFEQARYFTQFNFINTYHQIKLR